MKTIQLIEARLIATMLPPSVAARFVADIASGK